jgi:hypothetical protein
MPTSASQSQLDLSGLDRLEQHVMALGNIAFEPLMATWEDLMHEDNEESALKGLDGFGFPLIPVTYRPNPNKVKPTDYTILPYNNLTSSHYRTLDGPPLAPRGAGSRIVTNFRTASAELSDGRWSVVGAWEDIFSPTGIPFLSFHFRGEGYLPIRDLRGLRPSLIEQARAALRAFMRDYLRWSKYGH